MYSSICEQSNLTKASLWDIFFKCIDNQKLEHFLTLIKGFFIFNAFWLLQTLLGLTPRLLQGFSSSISTIVRVFLILLQDHVEINQMIHVLCFLEL